MAMTMAVIKYYETIAPYVFFNYIILFKIIKRRHDITVWQVHRWEAYIHFSPFQLARGGN